MTSSPTFTQIAACATTSQSTSATPILCSRSAGVYTVCTCSWLLQPPRSSYTTHSTSSGIFFCASRSSLTASRNKSIAFPSPACDPSHHASLANLVTTSDTPAIPNTYHHHSSPPQPPSTYRCHHPFCAFTSELPPSSHPFHLLHDFRSRPCRARTQGTHDR